MKRLKTVVLLTLSGCFVFGGSSFAQEESGSKKNQATEQKVAEKQKGEDESKGRPKKEQPKKDQQKVKSSEQNEGSVKDRNADQEQKPARKKKEPTQSTTGKSKASKVEKTVSKKEPKREASQEIVANKRTVPPKKVPSKVIVKKKPTSKKTAAVVKNKQKKELKYNHRTFLKMFKKDPIKAIQYQAVLEGQSELGHWGWQPDSYTRWGTHSNRLVPVYTFGTKDAKKGVRLEDYTGENSIYRRKNDLFRLYKSVPEGTTNPNAAYMDQTDIFRLQQAALEAGKKNIFLVVFDGMDWQTTWAASLAKSGQVPYRVGRGTGLHFQDYQADGTTEFAEMVTSPHNDGTKTNVDSQTITNPGEGVRGGYDPTLAGPTSWSVAGDLEYLIAKGNKAKHAYTDSASSATSMMSGIKTYNAAISVDPNGRKTVTIGHLAQSYGYAVGAVSSVPVSHATPASAYAHNVSRKDYQDLTRDLLGLPSISHPRRPLQGLDVLIGGGYGTGGKTDKLQGKNYVPGNTYLTKDDLASITFDPKNPEESGPYLVAIRKPGVNGRQNLLETAKKAAEGGHRLFGFYGVSGNGGHLPYRTADGDYRPTIGRNKKAEKYTKADIVENPTLSEMTEAALTVLQKNKKGMWLMVEAGDVDWANHDNNIDNSIGAVISGDRAVKTITDWVEKNSNWKESVLIVTADHGHYLVINKPELLLGGAKKTNKSK